MLLPLPLPLPKPAATPLTRFHRSRLLQVWRSAGWPCRDGIEIDLLAAQLLALKTWPDGRETLALTDAGIAVLADARRAGQRALSAHDRLANRFAQQLIGHGRIVWRELSLRALLAGTPAVDPAIEPHVASAAGPAVDPAVVPVVDTAVDTAVIPAGVHAVAAAEAPTNCADMWADDTGSPPAAASMATNPAAPTTRRDWRMARPDLFSVRNTTVEAYLRPMVHEIKTSRADLLSDMRHAAKRQAYLRLCSASYYVFPAGLAQVDEIPPEFGVWVQHGAIDSGSFELLRPARHAGCKLPFAAWLALAKATPVASDQEPGAEQGMLGEDAALPDL